MPSHNPMNLNCSNKTTISIVYNPIHHYRTKHVEIDRHFIKEEIEEELICITIPMKQQTADMWTEGFPRQNFEDLTYKLGILDIFSQLEGEWREY